MVSPSFNIITSCPIGYTGRKESIMYLREEIERFIREYEGTAIGYSVKNMYENGTDLEYICDYLGWDYEDFVVNSN